MTRPVTPDRGAGLETATPPTSQPSLHSAAPAYPSTEYTAEMAHAAVAAGEEWLDGKCPDWLEEINLDTLKLASPTACMLGQTASCLTGRPVSRFGHGYALVLQKFGLDSEWAIRHGFEVPSPHGSNWLECNVEDCNAETQARYEMLTIAWSSLIKERLAVSA